MLLPVVLAGGSGTRLWPLSRRLYPKQLMALSGTATMLQNTLRRLSGLSDVDHPIVICNDHHRFMVAEQLRADGIEAKAIILEPVGRNTAPAVTIAAIHALEEDRQAVLAVLPADHFIRDQNSFQAALTAGRRHAARDKLITFGVVPTAPETGYGYIKKGHQVLAVHDSPSETPEAVRIEAFVEKPDVETARQYLESGQYCWNSGIFMFKAERLLAEMERLAPDIVVACQESVDNGRSDLDFFRLEETAFSRCPSDSLDYAVMEKTDRGVMIPFEAGWNDLGSWEALWDVGDKDEHRNVLLGDVVCHDVSRSYLRADSRLVAAVGIEDLIVMETADSVLVAPRARAQDVKHVVDRLQQKGRREALSHKTDYRPWGSCESLVVDERFHVNRLTVNPGGKLALQKHAFRAEHWVILAGRARVTKENEVFRLMANQSVYFPPGTRHRLENNDSTPLEVIEIQTGDIISETDIERLEDVYGR
ncbi:MAG: mannose-1-phosphate guanylyltransferase/mannose-6-phosphate isomerase [Desulfosudaceae bacterium]